MDLRPDHSYVLNCMMCHAHDTAACFAPAETLWFIEQTNLPTSRFGSLAQPEPTPPAVNPPFSVPGFPHNRRSQLLMVDLHTMRLTQKQYQSAAGTSEFWYPNGSTDRAGDL